MVTMVPQLRVIAFTRDGMRKDGQPVAVLPKPDHDSRKLRMREGQLDAEVRVRTDRPVMPAPIDNLCIGWEE